MSSNSQDHIPLAVVGYDFRLAPARLRSKLVLAPPEQDDLARRLASGDFANGLACLITCNRNEWLASAANPAWSAEIMRAQVLRLLRDRTRRRRVPEPYVFVGKEAVRHVLRVTTGLESYVLGERQISGQVNRALLTAHERGRSSAILNGLGNACGRAAREAAELMPVEGAFHGVHDVGIAYLLRCFDEGAAHTALVVGFGDVGRRVVQGIRRRTAWRVVVCNRTVTKGGKETIHPLASLAELVPKADMMVVCTGAPNPVLLPERLGRVSPERGLTIVDLGIPIQADPACGELDGVYLVDLDVLQESVVIGGSKARNIRLVEQRIETIIGDFARFCRERGYVGLLKTTQTQHERFVNEVIPSLLDNELPQLPKDARKRLAFKLRGVIREYTNSIFNSIHQTTSDRHDEHR